MSDVQTEKLEYFEREIMNRVKAESEAIRAETQRMKDEALEQEKARLYDELYNDIQAKVTQIRKETAGEIAHETQRMKQALYRQREQYLAELLAEARVELVSFCKSGAYREFLLGRVRSLARDWRMDGSVVKVRADDLHYEADIRALYPGCTVEADDAAVPVGGVVLVNRARGVEIDLSLGAALAQQKDWFYHNSNFMLEDVSTQEGQG